MSVIPAGALGGATMSAIPAGALSGLGGALAGGLPGEIIVSAARPAISGALSGIGGAALGTGINALTPSLSQIANPSLKDIADSYGQEQMDTVTGVRTPPPSVAPTPVPVGGIANIFGPQEVLGRLPMSAEEEMQVTGKRYGDPTIGDYLAVPVSATYPIPSGAVDALPDDILSTEEPMQESVGQRNPPFVTPPFAPPPFSADYEGIPIAAALAAPAVIASGGASQGPLGTSTPAAVATGAGVGGAIKTGLDYLQGGLGALSVINGVGGLIGGGGNAGGTGAGIGGNMGTYSYQPLNRTQNAPAFDPFTYGQNAGEFKFFNDAQPVYQTGIGAAGIAPPPQVPLQLAKGGHVRGIGGGQDDLIDARLSDGEYVISAQDVADLGDGSNEHGARRLDEMRRLIRKNAGRKNVKTIAKPQKSVSSLLRAVK
jgi:hypothetical protein